MKNPIQPLYTDDNGTARFKSNKIVEYLLDKGGIDLNDIARAGFTHEWSQDDKEQFAQLIGYSLYGFSDLGYVSENTFWSAEKMWKNKEVSELEARCEHLEAVLKVIQKGLKEIVPEVFRIHPDDLTV